MSAGILAGTMLIPIIIYTYSGILGYNLLYLDIATFYISVILAFMIIYKTAYHCRIGRLGIIYELSVFVLIILFLIFRYNPPKLEIFNNPALSEPNQAENSVINYVKQLCIDIFRNQKYTGIFNNLFNS